MYNDEKINNIVKEFNETIDTDIQFQKDINDFARQISSQLIFRINNSEAVIGEFYDRNFAFTAWEQHSRQEETFYAVKIMDLNEYKKYLKIGVPEKTRAKRATFEYLSDYNLEEQLHKAIVMLLFDEFNIPIKPEEEEE